MSAYAPPLIGGPIIGGTSGSLLFADANGNFGQDNTNLFWDAINHRLGIGTITPAEALTLVGNFSVKDASVPTKAYRFRTQGNTNLDIDATGRDLYISTYYPGGDFTGVQTQYMQLGAQFQFEKHYQKFICTRSDGSDGLVWDHGSNSLSVTGYIITSGKLVTSSAIDGIGYATGAGGTVTQLTSKTTGVTLNKATGQITMNNAALINGGIVSFTLTNSVIAATDIIALSVASGASVGSYQIVVEAVAAGSCGIQLRNISAGTLSEAIVINFAVIKGVTA